MFPRRLLSYWLQRSASLGVLVASTTLALAQTPASAPRASDSASTDELRIGMSTVLSGPARDLGIEMRAGVSAAFDEYNAALAADAPRLRLIALDDGYEPDRCAPNMRRLVEHEKVLAVVGNVGTPTAIAAVPIAMENQTLFFGAFTGAGVLRKDPPQRYVVNVRASYAEETAAMVDALVAAGIEPTEVAFFTQRDAYGDSGYSGGLAALRRHGLGDNQPAHGRYERNTSAVEGALSEVLLARVPPRAVIMVGAYAPCAEFIRLAHAVAFDALFLNVSFVGARSLASELGALGDGVIVTQVVPHYDADLPLVRQYRASLELNSPELEPSFGSLEGYVTGRVFCRALAAAGGRTDREGIVDALLGLGRFDLGLGAELELGPERHQACTRVWPTILRGGKFAPFDWAELKRKPAHG